MTDLERRQERGAHADRLLNDVVLNEVLDELERDYIEAVLACDKEDDEGRYRLSVAATVVRTVRQQFRSLVADGKLASEAADELKTSRWGV